MRRLFTTLLLGAMLVLGLAGCGEKKPASQELPDVTVKVGAMSGPTAMTIVKLMSQSEAGETKVKYSFADLTTDATSLVAPLAKGELDIALIPSNLASTLFNNNKADIKVLATCNTGVLYIVERGSSIKSIKDLKGQTVYMTGQGAVPEAVVNYLLTQNGIDPEKDLTIHFCSDTTEALSFISADEKAIAVLPEPFVTAASAQVSDLKVSVDLNTEWAALNNGCSIITGVVVVRKEFAEKYPEVVKEFLKEYKESVAFTASNVEDTAALIEKYGIVKKAALAKKALPKCNLTAKTGTELKTALSGFLKVLYDQNPKSVGGKMPQDDFYYNE